MVHQCPIAGDATAFNYIFACNLTVDEKAVTPLLTSPCVLCNVCLSVCLCACVLLHSFIQLRGQILAGT